MWVSEPVYLARMATILVVDDDPNIRQMLCDLIVDLGHTALSAHHGRAALAVAQAHRPDLILSDVMMPVMDGYALVRALRDDPVLATTTIFLMSAAPGRPASATSTPPVNGFIPKPFDLSAVENLFENLPTRAA